MSRRVLLLMALAPAVLLAGCCTEELCKREAIAAVDVEFAADYEALLADDGSRRYAVDRGRAVKAMRGALTRLGLTLENVDEYAGLVQAVAPAPTPLDEAEWEETQRIELPRMREIMAKHVGFVARFAKLRPDLVDIVITAAVIDAGADAVEVSVTMRMRWVKPPSDDWPARSYPPPHGFKLGLAKFWRAFESELGAVLRKA